MGTFLLSRQGDIFIESRHSSRADCAVAINGEAREGWHEGGGVSAAAWRALLRATGLRLDEPGP